MTGTAEKKSSYTEREIEAMSTQELFTAYKESGDESLKWPLALRYEGLIKSAAIQFRGVYSSFAQVDDIVSEGILTLISAIDKFDPDKGVKFETYVSKRIRGMVIDLARKQDWLPRNLRKRAKEIDKVTMELYSELGHFPSDAEIAEKLGVTLDKYQKDVSNVVLSNILSLDALMDMYEMDGGRFEVPSQETYGQPENYVQERETQRILAEAISRLRENEQIVLSLYYEKNLRMKEIAQVMDVSEPRISQIHSRAIQKLRVYMGGEQSKTKKDGRKN